MNRPTHPSASGPRWFPDPPREERHLWIVPLIAVAAVLAYLLVMNLRTPLPGTSLTEPPPEALGRWTTKDPRYAQRALVVSTDSVTLDVGPGQAPRRGIIRSVRRWKEGIQVVLRIEYDAGDGVEALEMLWQGPDSMRLRHPPEILWTRQH
jgi:hypothetical protein